jgi:carbon storage regulator
MSQKEGFLLLGRKQDQSVFIGDDVEVRVIAIKRGSVLLGFKAPKNVNIERDDIVKTTKGE